MKIVHSSSTQSLGEAAGKFAGDIIRQAISGKGRAHIIVATGASQFETLKQLVAEEGIDWGKVVMFHLDEYIGLPVTHPASFRKYLRERFLAKLPPLSAAYLIDGETDPAAEISRLNAVIRQHPVDLALVGIGENGHLAFNDPPADFDTSEPYLVVNLDVPCRKQQLNEGWFGSLEEVPLQAISMSVNHIMQSQYIIASVPDRRKAQAVKDSVEQEVSNLFPASVLQRHDNCYLYLDPDSASLLTEK